MRIISTVGASLINRQKKAGYALRSSAKARACRPKNLQTEEDAQAEQSRRERQFGAHPGREEILLSASEPQPGRNGHDHRRIHDALEQPPLHDLEQLRGLGFRLRAGVTDEEPRQVEHSRHPRYDGENMQRLDPKVRRFHGAHCPIDLTAERLHAKDPAEVNKFILKSN